MDDTQNKIDNELVDKIIKLQMTHCVKESELYLKFISNQINFYEQQLRILRRSKPFKFQKKKLKEYNDEILKYETKIMDSYRKYEEELDFIYQTNNEINNN